MKKILIIQANFYGHISEMLLEGAIKKITEKGFEYEVVAVPGAFEIPTVIAFAKDSDKYQGYVALGCIIRGETTHYDYVCYESARGLNKLAMKYKLAVGNAILTVESEEQAMARASVDGRDKGGFAANACLEMLELKKKFAC